MSDSTQQVTQFFRPEEVERLQVAIYKTDVVLHYKLKPSPTAESKKRAFREQIAEFSSKSEKRLGHVAANTAVEFTHMITLTYPAEFTNDGRESKRHLQVFLQWLRRRGASYLWCLEFQARGAPHYHVFVNINLDAMEAKQAISERWFKIVGSDDPKHLRAGTNVERMRTADGAARYALKYAYKRHQKNVPAEFKNVGRMWGHSVDVAPRATNFIDVPQVELLRDLLGDCWAVDELEAWERGERELPPSIVFGSTIDRDHVNSFIDELRHYGYETELKQPEYWKQKELTRKLIELKRKKLR